jgi:hypothetical protein
MQLPNKLFSYNESILSKFPIILKILEKEPLTVGSLYVKIEKQVSSINEYIEILDALFALNKIIYDDEQGVLYCAI